MKQYAQSVMVQSWLDGQVVDAPPAAEAEWQRLIEQHALMHSVSAAKLTCRCGRSLVPTRWPVATNRSRHNFSVFRLPNAHPNCRRW
ncbi:MAG: hypothetical protein R3A44_39210 [Caldilineaceae bacterium]